MVILNLKLKEKIKESLSAVLPITAIVILLSISLVPLDVGSVVMFFGGALMLIVGMGMFQLGAEMSMSPLGEGIGGSLSKSKKTLLILFISFLMGVIITIAEPDLQVLSNQVPSIPNAVLILTVAVGVGLFLATAVLRIIFKINLSVLLLILYLVIIIFSFFVPKEFLAVAFDSGGVTTGPMTVPFIMAVGVGLSSMRGDKDASSDSFGLVALSSVGPILAVMILGLFYSPKDAVIESVIVPEVETMQDVFLSFVTEIPHYLKEVSLSLLPIVAVFVLYALISRKYRKRQFLRITVGFIYTFIGLVFFLCGVNIGFAPVGNVLGSELGIGNKKWLLVPIGMLIGYFIVKAEPAIQILNRQVQSLTNGTVSAKTMNRCLSVGVAVSIGLSVLRILLEIPIQWIVIPGYVIALALTFFVPKIFVGIAFDSGGVASGPMTSTFLLPLCIGACSAVGGNIMTDAFGAVALVALAPLIAIQLMGLKFRIDMRKRQKYIDAVNIIPDEYDDIIDLEEEQI